MSWIQTYTGKHFYPLNPRPEDVDIRDIAHALSLQTRFAGHCREFYSVAEHSIRVSRLLWNTEDELWGLLHDASEAYLCDIPRPLKYMPEMQAYRDAEKAVQRAICERFGLSEQEPTAVKLADNTLLATEARDLMIVPPSGWQPMSQPLFDKIIPQPMHTIRCDFMRVFDMCMVKRDARSRPTCFEL